MVFLNTARKPQIQDANFNPFWSIFDRMSDTKASNSNEGNAHFQFDVPVWSHGQTCAREDSREECKSCVIKVRLILRNKVNGILKKSIFGKARSDFKMYP